MNWWVSENFPVTGMVELNSMALLDCFKGDKCIVSYWEFVQQPCREENIETASYKEVTDTAKATKISMCSSDDLKKSSELSERLLRKLHCYTFETDAWFETLIQNLNEIMKPAESCLLTSYQVSVVHL